MKLNKIKVSIVVLSYNRIDRLPECLQTIAELISAEVEVIVVDNASSDGSVEFVQKNHPDCRLIVNSENLGVSRGRNVGFQAVMGDYIIYLDDDSIAPTDIVEKTVTFFRAHPECGVIAYAVMDGHENQLSNGADHGDQLLNYHGAGHAFRRDVLVKINYLDEKLFFGAEEVESSIRVYKAGFSILFYNGVVIQHKCRTSESTNDVKIERLLKYFYAFSYFYTKHFPRKYAWPYIGGLYLSHCRYSLMSLGSIAFVFKAPLLLKQRTVSQENTPQKVLDFYTKSRASIRLPGRSRVIDWIRRTDNLK